MSETLKNAARQICPPFVWKGVQILVRPLTRLRRTAHSRNDAGNQDLDIYWDDAMAEVLETWGAKTVWKEIPLLIANCHGRVLDIACGTGKTIEILSGLPVDIHGCDISDLLISKAISRGISPDHLTVCDATNMPYDDDSFDYGYSIGSLEHFTEDGIGQFLSECHRVVSTTTFHMIPVSRSGKDEGWLKTYQSFHNNSVDWWLDKFNAAYPVVLPLDSTWEDNISVGKWFVCSRESGA